MSPHTYAPIAFFFTLLGCGARDCPEPQAHTPAHEAHGARARPLPPAEPSTDPIHVTGADITLLVNGSRVHVHHVDATLASLDGEPLVLREPDSYQVTLHSAELGITPDGLTQLLHEPVENARKVDELTIGAYDGMLWLSGVLRPGRLILPMRFRASVEPVALDDGRLGLRADQLELTRIDVDQVLGRFDLELSDLLDLSSRPHLSIEGNTIGIDIFGAVDATELKAAIVSAEVVEDGVLLQLAEAPGMLPAERTDRVALEPSGSTNSITFTGGAMQVGDVMLLKTRLEIVDQAPETPLSLDTSDLKRQLKAAYTKRFDGGIRMFLPDHDSYTEQDIVAGPLPDPLPPCDGLAADDSASF